MKEPFNEKEYSTMLVFITLIYLISWAVGVGDGIDYCREDLLMIEDRYNNSVKTITETYKIKEIVYKEQCHTDKFTAYADGATDMMVLMANAKIIDPETPEK